MNWTIVQKHVTKDNILPEAKEDIIKAFNHSRIICDLDPEIKTLDDLLDLPMKDFYIYISETGDYALVEIKFKPSLKSTDLSIYVKEGTGLQNFQHLFNRGRALLARINLERGWNGCYVDFISQKAVDFALSQDKSNAQVFKIYDNYFVLYGTYTEEQLKEYILDFGQDDGYEVN